MRSMMQATKLMKHSLILMALSIVLATASMAQQPTTDTVQNSRATTDANSTDELTLYKQRVVKLLEALESSEKVVVALQSQNEAQRTLNATNDALIAKQKEIIENQQKLITMYEKRPRMKVKFLFGLISISKN